MYYNKCTIQLHNQSCKLCMTTLGLHRKGHSPGSVTFFFFFSFRYFRLHKITHDNTYFLRQLANSPHRVFLFVLYLMNLLSAESSGYSSRRWKLLKQNNAVSQVKVDVDADSDRTRRETSIVRVWHDVITLKNIPLLLSVYFLHSWRVVNVILLSLLGQNN